MARHVTAHLFHAVNGVVESPDQWQFDAFGSDDMANMRRSLESVTDVVLGRTLWQEWAEYWPRAGSGDPFAEFINPVRKHVISSTLKDVSAWQNSTLIDGDPVAYLRDLADSKTDGMISVAGGIETIRSLFLAGAVDTLTLTTHPVVGTGRRLFDDSVPVTRLELLETLSTSSGNAVLTYRLRP